MNSWLFVGLQGVLIFNWTLTMPIFYGNLQLLCSVRVLFICFVVCLETWISTNSLKYTACAICCRNWIWNQPSNRCFDGKNKYYSQKTTYICYLGASHDSPMLVTCILREKVLDEKNPWMSRFFVGFLCVWIINLGLSHLMGKNADSMPLIFVREGPGTMLFWERCISTSRTWWNSYILVHCIFALSFTIIL